MCPGESTELAWMDVHGRAMPFPGPQTSISEGVILGQKQDPCTSTFYPDSTDLEPGREQFNPYHCNSHPPFYNPPEMGCIPAPALPVLSEAVISQTVQLSGAITQRKYNAPAPGC